MVGACGLEGGGEWLHKRGQIETPGRGGWRSRHNCSVVLHARCVIKLARPWLGIGEFLGVSQTGT